MEIYSRLGTILILLILGFLLGKLKMISAETNKHLVNLLLMVFMPASLFSAFPATYSEDSLHTFISGLVAGFIVMLAGILASRLIFNKHFFKTELRYESQFAFIFNNATFLGYPIVSHAFGEAGIIPYCGFIVAFNLALFSYGIYLFERKISWRLLRQTVTNPNIIAVLLGMLFFLLNFQLPSFMNDAISFTGAATTPLSLICIGYMLSRAQISKLIKQWRLIIVAAIQLTVSPAITYFILLALNFPPEVIIVCTLIQALPTATSLGLFAAKYGGNETESSELVTISTLLSVVTLPLILAIFLV